MSSKNQTAVEWLVQEIEKQCPQIDITWKENLINQAKELEKQQIIAAYIKGQSDCEMFTMQSEAEQYYNDTFL